MPLFSIGLTFLGWYWRVLDMNYHSFEKLYQSKISHLHPNKLTKDINPSLSLVIRRHEEFRHDSLRDYLNKGYFKVVITFLNHLAPTPQN